MKLLDVTNWERDEKSQVSGTRAKYWLIHPETDKRYLFKIPRAGTGEAWAEKVASEVGKIIGITTIDVTLAFRGNTVAVLIDNFVKRQEELYEGGDLFFTIVNDFDRYSLEHYNLFNAINVLSEFNLDRDFIKIPIFDALIGNQDRHCDNWGIINSRNGYRLAPVYDNGSSLGFQLKEDRVCKMLQDDRMFKGYVNRSYSLIGLPGRKKPRCLDLLSVIKQHYPLELKETFELIQIMNEQKLEEILELIPVEIMSLTYKNWVKCMLLYRKKWLLSWYKEVLTK